MIGDRIVALRTEQGIGPDLLARACGISRATLHAIECGATLRPQAATLRKLADALGVTPADLTAGHNLRLIDAGWWPAKKVNFVLRALDALGRTPPYEADDVARGISVEFHMRFSLLMHAAGIDVPEAIVMEAEAHFARPLVARAEAAGPVPRFAFQFDTPEQLQEYLAGRHLRAVRDRPAPDAAPTVESRAD